MNITIMMIMIITIMIMIIIITIIGRALRLDPGLPAAAPERLFEAGRKRTAEVP